MKYPLGVMGKRERKSAARPSLLSLDISTLSPLWLFSPPDIPRRWSRVAKFCSRAEELVLLRPLQCIIKNYGTVQQGRGISYAFQRVSA